MEIEIKNCNNIDSAKITIIANKLNIKFAPNGSGKSSIAKALSVKALKNQDRLNDLIPFKLRKTNSENKQPEVLGAESIERILCFNEEYVSQFVFKPDELLNNSFEILIKTDAYKQYEREIEELIFKIKDLFSDNLDLENLIDTLKKMASSFILSSSGLSSKSTGVKGLSKGNIIQHIPSGLEAYAPFIQSKHNIGWIDWQTKGCEYSELSDKCPFCTSLADDKKDQIKKVGEEYDKNTIKNLVSLIELIERLGDYFSPQAKANLKSITTLKEGLEKDHIEFLISVKKQIDSFIEKLERLRSLSAFQFKDDENVAEKLPAYKLDLQFFLELQSDQMQNAIKPLNASIDEVIKQASELQGKINKQRAEIKRTINKHQKDINEFLAFAGYRYEVEIAGEGNRSQLKLRHVDHDEHLNGGSQHLSFGEKNAFALVLFMYECLAKKPDLIILDDPISSFDKNKKYAILEMLFRRDTDSCLKNKTVLMLTHDVEPIIDTTKALAQKFSNQTSAAFLKLEGGIISECIIEKDDIQPFSVICQNSVSSNKDDIIKLIYLRRHFEIASNKGNAYQILSNILHKRDRVLDFREPKNANGDYPEMHPDKFSEGCARIIEHMSSFSYSTILTRIKDANVLKSLYQSTSNGYEKLQILRLLGLVIESSVIQKFINETYHIENEFICQLDPTKFDTIPEYVVAECNRMLLQS